MSNEFMKFVVKETKVKLRNGDVVSYASINLQDTRDGFSVVHPVTDFIRSRYATKGNYNTQRGPAQTIKRFLNWLLIDNKHTYGLRSFEDLQIKHGVEYLNYLGEERANSRTTVKLAERYLIEFYYFLNRRGILAEKCAVMLKTTNGKTGSIVSPFSNEGLALPSRAIAQTKINDFPDKRMITLFIETAQLVAPEIAFGIYLQCFGGLRRGEVVNLDRSSIEAKGSYGINGMQVEIKDRPSLFSRMRDVGVKNSVKNPRNQGIQVIPLLSELYRNHLALIESNTHVAKPLFIDRHGNPMSGTIYERRFNRVKSAFMKRLRDMSSPHFSHLAKYSWGTHIGRGIYTNLMASLVKTPTELALLRGDKTLDAAIPYMAMMRVQNEIKQGLDDMYNKGELKFLDQEE